MNVVPRSLRPRNRRMTTEWRDASVTFGSALSKVRAAAKNRLPYGSRMTTSPAGTCAGGSVSMMLPSGSSVRCLIVIRLDCRTTYRMSDKPTPTRTANWSGMSIVSANVVTSTIFWTTPVFHTDSRSAGLIVR